MTTSEAKRIVEQYKKLPIDSDESMEIIERMVEEGVEINLVFSTSEWPEGGGGIRFTFENEICGEAYFSGIDRTWIREMHDLGVSVWGSGYTDEAPTLVVSDGKHYMKNGTVIPPGERIGTIDPDDGITLDADITPLKGASIAIEMEILLADEEEPEIVRAMIGQYDGKSNDEDVFCWFDFGESIVGCDNDEFKVMSFATNDNCVLSVPEDNQPPPHK